MNTKCFSSIVVLFLTLSTSFAQDFTSDSLKFNGLRMLSSKSEIIAALGQPERIYEPNYECGYFSSDEQGKPFYEIVYENVVFIGNEKDRYLLRKINFVDGVTISYGNQVLSNKSNLDRLIDVFGMEKFGSLHDASTDSAMLFNKGADGGWEFVLKNGKLVKIGFWSPC